MEETNETTGLPSSSTLLPTGPPVDLSPLLSEDVVYKLGLLDYRTSFCIPQDIKPFSRHFFACAPSNASSFQFNAFASITTWLLQLNKRISNPNASGEDPVTFSNKLISELRGMGWGDSVDRDLPLMKLRLGAGEAVCRVLLFLSEKALAMRGFVPITPDFSSSSIKNGSGGNNNTETFDVLQEEIVEENDAAEDDAVSLIDSTVSYGIKAGYKTTSKNTHTSSTMNGSLFESEQKMNDNTIEDEEEETVLFSENALVGHISSSSTSSASTTSSKFNTLYSNSSNASGVFDSKVGNESGGKESDFSTLRADLASDKKATAMIEPTVDAQVWRAEVDRVAPKLAAAPLSSLGHVHASSGGHSSGGGGSVQKGEWRAHLEQSTRSNAIVTSLLPTSKGSLERLSEDLNQLLELVRGREKSINISFKHLMIEHKSCAEKTTESQLAVQAVQGTVNKLSRELSAISEVLEEVKQNIEEKGNSVTDTSPLIKVKAALSSIRAECRSLDLQIGVVSHAVLQARITHKRDIHRGGDIDDDTGINVN